MPGQIHRVFDGRAGYVEDAAAGWADHCVPHSSALAFLKTAEELLYPPPMTQSPQRK
ncbi:hypothetical protein GCM10009727_70600 [Actinomadura napierensis]|uniref:Uncharacterized protein n=1 Tax=Actinomadura napierensis TaxID=267854 RepID=A0ABN3ABS0_9ACTN